MPPFSASRKEHEETKERLRMAIAKRKKRFYDIEIPIIGKTTQLQAYDLKDLNNKYIKYDLTRILRGKSIILNLKVQVQDKEAITIPKEIILMSYYLKRMIRKGTNYVEDSFSTNTTDAQVRIKPFLVTRRKVSRRVRKALRDKTKEELINYVKDKDADQLFKEILRNQLQKTLSLKLKKIYPLSLCEIRVFKIEKEFEIKGKPVKKDKTEKPLEEQIIEEPITEETEEKPTKKIVKKKVAKKKTE